MKTVNKLMAVVICSIAIVSCQKSETPPVDNTLPPALLTKWFAVDTTLTHPLDTFVRAQISYDALDRPVLHTYTDFKPNGDSNYHWRVSYTYNGSDSFAARTIEYTREFQGTIDVDTDTFYYTFSGQLIAKDSMRGGTGAYYQTNRYSYLPAYIRRDYSDVSTVPQASITGYSHIFQQKVNGNVTYQIDTLIRTRVATGQPTTTSYMESIYTVSYIASPNPFYKITRPVKREFFAGDNWLPDGRHVSPNLISNVSASTRFWGNGTGGGSHTHQNSYVFRADGYPVQCRKIQSEPGIPTRIISLIYIYNQ